MMVEHWKYDFFNSRYYAIKLIEEAKKRSQYKFISLVKKYPKLYIEYIKAEIIQRKHRSKDDFYKSEGWAKTRSYILKRDSYMCQDCKSKDNLHVHHIKYKQVSNLARDLITLCSDCHKKIHSDC